MLVKAQQVSQIDRGTERDGDAQILFDESIEHVNPTYHATQVYGTFKFVRTDGQMVGIRAPTLAWVAAVCILILPRQPNPSNRILFKLSY